MQYNYCPLLCLAYNENVQEMVLKLTAFRASGYTEFIQHDKALQ
jgi:hypothetical protein